MSKNKEASKEAKKSPFANAAIIAAGFFIVLEIITRFIPLEYAAGAGIFLTNQRRQLAEASGPEYDYIILGDSRSLSLKGHFPSAAEPYSIYNFSMPAMGTRYFTFLLRKYLKNRSKKPSAIIFAGDPGLFKNPWAVPLHDPQMIYSDTLHDSLATYLWNRFYRRIQIFLSGGIRSQENKSLITGEMLWDSFSHRYLHLFSLGELSEQYTGAERIFILREAVPLLYNTYKYRESIVQYTFGLTKDTFVEHPLPPECHTCGGLLKAECHPDIPRIEDARRIERQLQETNGQINLSDRLAPSARFSYMSMRADQIKTQVEMFAVETPVLDPVEDLIREAEASGIKVIFSDVPAMKPYENTRYHRIYFQKLEEIVKRHPGARIIRFPEPYYPENYFVEQVHYDCEGSDKLNRDFYSGVMPQILKFAPPGSGSWENQRMEPAR